MDNRALTLSEVERLRWKLIKHKDRPALKRLRKKLIRLNEYRWFMKQYK